MHSIRMLLRIDGITYNYTLIDDAVARVMKSEGGLSGHARTTTEM
jgi:hypothetical protein